MIECCDNIQRQFCITGMDERLVPDEQEVFSQCVRHKGHFGPHLIKSHRHTGGEYIIYQHDLCEEQENCEACESDDPDDWCVTYQVVSSEEAVALIIDPKLVPDGWDRY